VGEVAQVPYPETTEEWVKLSEDSDVICGGGGGLYDNLSNMKDVFVTYPYIELGTFDSEKLKEQGVVVANTQGSNRDSIVEWAMFMMLSLHRKFPAVVNVKDDIPLEFNQSLVGKNVLIVGKGSIGTQVGKLSEAFGMNVEFFERGDDLVSESKDADVIVNSLNCNSSSKNLLDEKFFISLKQGAYYITFARQHTYDLAGLIKSLDEGVLAGAAIDCDPEKPGDTKNEYYSTVVKHDKILATPHIAFATKQASTNAMEIMVQNVEAYLGGKPQNVLTKI